VPGHARRALGRTLQAQFARQQALPVDQRAVRAGIVVRPAATEQLLIEPVQLDRASDQAID
jgi:hypothetical protein